MTQEFITPLEEGACYSFDIDICSSRKYLSNTRKSKNLVNHIAPTVLKVYLSNEICAIYDPVFTSEIISEEEWDTISVNFKSQHNYRYIILAAGNPNIDSPQCGHILLDNIMNFQKANCGN